MTTDYVDTGWIQTHTGRAVKPLALRAEDIDIRDIAHALSNQCRFSGHTQCFYSVAQHSVLVSENCQRGDALWGLLHDASEAYLVDLPRPVKAQPELACYREAESRAMAAVCTAFGLPLVQPDSVSEADVLLLATEARDFMAPLCDGWHHTPANGFAVLPERIKPWTPGAATWAFLKRFRELTGKGA